MDNKPNMMVTYKRPDGGFTHTQYEQDGIVFAAHTGQMEIEDAKKLVEIFRDFEAKLGGKFLYFLDMKDFKGASTEARKYLNDEVHGENTPYKKFTAAGGSFIVRNLANMYARIVRFPMRHFKTKDEAMTWLKK